MPEDESRKAEPPSGDPDGISGNGPERTFVHRIVRYAPSLLRDEWINIGVLLFDPKTGERRLRLIEEEEEFNRVRRLHPQADEGLLRALRDHLESRFAAAAPGDRGAAPAGNGGNRSTYFADNGDHPRDWFRVLEKWDQTLSNALRLADPKATQADDLDLELARLYDDRVAVPQGRGRVGLLGSRASLRSHCSNVLHHAKIWNRLEKSVRASQFTFPGDPMRIDYGYRRNGTRGFVHTLSVTRAPAEAKTLAYTAERIEKDGRFPWEFRAVTDVPLGDSDRHRFVRDTLRAAGIEPVPREGFAVWVAKLRPMLQ
jgi:Protein of unknown function (DUF3037)